jgi:hypothetical protein
MSGIQRFISKLLLFIIISKNLSGTQLPNEFKLYPFSHKKLVQSQRCDDLHGITQLATYIGYIYTISKDWKVFRSFKNNIT